MKVFPEITPVSDENLFVLQHHHNADFDYPIHLHDDFELTLVEGCNGRRIVGNSVENFEQEDLVFLGPNIQHKWMKEEGSTDKPCVTTIQFRRSIFSDSLLKKNEFESIKGLFSNSGNGVVFEGTDRYRIKLILKDLVKSSGFERVLLFFNLLHQLGISLETRSLASDGFIGVHPQETSRRINKVLEFIFDNYHRSIDVQEAALLISMSDSAFSHFFKKRTGKSFIKFVNDIRLGKAAFFLINSNKNIAEICYECGFNNLSNFNRQFKKFKGVTPSDFRKSLADLKSVEA
ncbi:AraC family transcriptional regulator [Flammeovirga pacifica]|uniref:HTH araC/xylS-type domain-containing protein n=1 Tax=Flammeovirga pacifica TaxID=915059 RepID=A0A1S1Z3J9_FLAPC|nr:AraC family transcriptional regulator [Flammeovirga pacifica]OHX67864.1 hypothetical protein NH26_16730 [Flammeovirga pacifica]